LHCGCPQKELRKRNFDTRRQDQLSVRSAAKGAHATDEMTGVADAGALFALK
jgi:hypothetical protein